MVMRTQAPLPSQAEARCATDVPAGQLAPHAPAGSVPAATGVQAPTLPASAHDLQPPQASSQQIPWAQCVLMQSPSPVQLWPLGVRLVHEPIWQVSPLTQSPL